MAKPDVQTTIDAIYDLLVSTDCSQWLLAAEKKAELVRRIHGKEGVRRQHPKTPQNLETVESVLAFAERELCRVGV